MTPPGNSTNERKIVDRIMNLVQNLTDEKKRALLELLIEWQQRENRNHQRVVCYCPVDYTDQKRVYHDFIQDLSRGGLFIETRESLTKGESIALTFSMPKSRANFKMTGKVVRNERHGVAIQFDNQLSNYQEEAIVKSFERNR